MRVEHHVAAWIAVTALVACGGPAAGGGTAAGGNAAQAAPPSVQADALAPSRVVDPDHWADPRVRSAYAAARKYAAIMEHIYCHCHCKENLGHRGLVECFESDHAAMCDICMAEAMTVARMTEQGRTPAEIQKAIDAFYAS
jgi:hypothetical protein